MGHGQFSVGVTRARVCQVSGAAEQGRVGLPRRDLLRGE